MDYNSIQQYINICKVLGLSQVFAWYLAIKMTTVSCRLAFWPGIPTVESQLEPWPPMGSGNVSTVAEEKKFNPRLTQNKAPGNPLRFSFIQANLVYFWERCHEAFDHVDIELRSIYPEFWVCEMSTCPKQSFRWSADKNDSSFWLLANSMGKTQY